MGEGEREIWSSLPHSSFDAVIMNPPFTRATNHEGNKSNVPNPVFAAFGADKLVQSKMAKRMKILTKDSAYHGNAGEASAFVAIGDKKLREDGVIALVLPLSALAGSGWEKVRRLVRFGYCNLQVVTIAAGKSGDSSFSADTGMAECLIVASKKAGGAKRGRFIVLRRTPSSELEGRLIAREVNKFANSRTLRRLEDGPFGGSPIKLGSDLIGEVLDAPVPDNGPWPVSRISDLSLAQAMHQMVDHSKLWLPGMNESDTLDIDMCRLGDLAKFGPIHRDINGTERQGSVPRGPFDVGQIPAGNEPTYPVLWSHNAKAERSFVVNPDSQGSVRAGADDSAKNIIRERVNRIFESASHSHFNYDFQYNSQSTCAVYTVNKSIGGRAWPSVKFENSLSEKVFVLWANTTLGLATHWWKANKTQAGRGTITLSALPNLPIFDFKSVASDTLAGCEELFEEFNTKRFMPINEIDSDETRHRLDERFFHEILGFPSEMLSDSGPLGLFRRKFGAEPSIRGGKKVK